MNKQIEPEHVERAVKILSALPEGLLKDLKSRNTQKKPPVNSFGDHSIDGLLATFEANSSFMSYLRNTYNECMEVTKDSKLASNIIGFVCNTTRDGAILELAERYEEAKVRFQRQGIALDSFTQLGGARLSERRHFHVMVLGTLTLLVALATFIWTVCQNGCSVLGNG